MYSSLNIQQLGTFDNVVSATVRNLVAVHVNIHFNPLKVKCKRDCVPKIACAKEPQVANTNSMEFLA